MANKTVYPYGTEGQLPSSIGLVNDLKTGGVDKALTAEQGVVIGQAISKENDISYAEGSALISAGSSEGQTLIGSIPVIAGHVYQIYVQSDDIVISSSVILGLGSNGTVASVGQNKLRTGISYDFTANTSSSSSRVYITVVASKFVSSGRVLARIRDLTDSESLASSFVSNTQFIDAAKINAITKNVEASPLAWEYGGINSETGADTASSSYIRSSFIPISSNPENVTVLYKDRYTVGYGSATLFFYDSTKTFVGTAYDATATFVRVVKNMYVCNVIYDLETITLYIDGERMPCGCYDATTAKNVAYRDYIEGCAHIYNPNTFTDAITLVTFPINAQSSYKIYLKSDVLLNLSSGSTITIGVGGSNGSVSLTPEQLYAGYTWTVTANRTASTCRLYFSNAAVSNYVSVYSKIEDLTGNTLQTPYQSGNSDSSTVSGAIDKLKELGFGAKNSKTVAKILHCSDIHGDSDRWQRISQFASDNSLVAIHTGDNIKSKWGADGGFDFLGTSEVTNILNCIGNHDGYNGRSWWGATPKEVYDEIIAPYVEDWDVVQPSNAAEDGLLYYYKDIGTRVRLIVLDTHNVNQNAGDNGGRSETVEGYTAAELSWFQSVLAAAITESRSVVVATHYILDNLICDIRTSWDEGRVSPAWAETDAAGYGCINTLFVDAVSEFIDNAGDFVCWLSGHLHTAQFSHSADDERQLQIVVANASMKPFANSAHARSLIGDYQDDFNVVAIYPDDHVIIVNRIGSTLTSTGTRQRIVAYDYKNNELLYSQE